MKGFSWTHLILAVLIIVFATMGTMYTWLVIVLAAVIAVLSIFGVCSCGSYRSMPLSAPKATVHAPRRKGRK